MDALGRSDMITIDYLPKFPEVLCSSGGQTLGEPSVGQSHPAI